ncbi:MULTISPECIES: WhiB family transcriptional regulator [unclassified Gordonia (in: high G+C Gram-positive bacteria)]|uniref:WhiB family transcriptional regulator n=1 Tax=unclassified Gordonia (in: high G+C Gram-positive bacteria) TaxID=2657482 RepID=UPI001F0DEF08|nr:WhiB family transcriptional regulator [Gordonia sp. ABSL49_1]MCH5645040.1 WhiB family transcriptional regulator [Gordonia sp. ABSL49_1]
MTVECVLESCLSANRVSVGRLDLPCQVADADLWFAEDPRDLERAKELCAECPLRTQCLQAAMDRAEPWGVWGGEIFERGTVIARKRPRGRPRKTVA